MSTLWISWSRLRTHTECARRGKLQRSGKTREIDDARGFFPGTVTDRVVTAWLNNDPEHHLGEMPDMVNAIIDSSKEEMEDQGRVVLFKSRADRNNILDDCVEAVTKIEADLKRHVLPYEYQPAFRFKAPLLLPSPDGGMETVIINGEMDILVRTPKGKYRVFDTKHTRDDNYWRKTVGQLAFYSFATNIMFGQPAQVTALLQPLCKERVKPWTTPPEKLSELYQQVSRYAWDTWSDDFPLTKNRKECTYCSVKHACPRFQPVNGRVAF